MKIVFFDCDETLWTSSDRDYISSVNSSLRKIDKNTLMRKADGKRFILKDDIFEVMEYLRRNKVLMGIVSDNEKRMVIEVLMLLGIYKYFDKKIVNIKLWDGYCPKEEMIIDALSSSIYKHIAKKDVYWFDDKDYFKEANKIKINFIKVYKGMNILKEIKKIEIS